MEKYLIVLVGPTAVGKTALSIQLAKALKTDIVSADSRQFFKELSIGTAKPDIEEMDGVPHHFIDCMSIHEPYSAGKFELDALNTIDEIFKTHDSTILTGGSGLYINAVCEGIDDMPPTPPEIRDNLMQRLENEGLEILRNELKVIDPQYFNEVDPNNSQRIVRALEVYQVSGKPISYFRKSKLNKRPFKMIKIGLERDREELYNRINQRMDIMIGKGLFEEAKKYQAYKEINALQTVGYKEIYDYLDGKYDYEEAVRLLKRNSRRYAKRQMTWFKRGQDYAWFHPDEFEKIMTHINEKIKRAN
ncbi:tRNA (adenosine(37)-N6)-dimethylallyltransferase MiaA [Aureibacter tunicatorum]|uniref:tRNA dimethylallyltransferase n=1 Tax=Aureibacter tunicatorum TaxID=866807 RepID=A0AAE3XPY3_9BACT|nr:tRNA (adenosine(37)-N6)-dimethylallyltransferase MiaA [Aureibacter tunicatorum]MDR6239895.1 tRNA dimethylallyltransferase [Aureibacter tunicatorum]BDD04370.1 tRNA dimethylallyltransferase 1 [Aureibacter tunicatorum]